MEYVRPPSCPYCGSVAVLRPAEYVYKYECKYGPMWVCAKFPECDSYVGCHPGTHKPLGPLSDVVLRYAKQCAHKSFDPLWKTYMNREGCSKGFARRAAYDWLSIQLKINHEECHIALMDADMCWRVVEICDPYTNPNKKSKSIRQAHAMTLGLGAGKGKAV